MKSTQNSSYSLLFCQQQFLAAKQIKKYLPKFKNNFSEKLLLEKTVPPCFSAFAGRSYRYHYQTSPKGLFFLCYISKHAHIEKYYQTVI